MSDTSRPDPTQIFQIGMGFMASKVLLSAVELELFTALTDHPMTGAQIGDRLGLHPRGLYDFLDALVAFKFVTREGDGHHGRYMNTPETATFLDKNKPSYVGGILEMCNHRLYRYWGDLTTALRTGQPQNEIKEGLGADGGNVFEALYADQERLEEFIRAMAGAQVGNFMALAEAFDFSQYPTFCDVGGASGALAIAVAKRHASVACTTYDLPPVGPIARRHVEAAGLLDRINVVDGDFFKDDLPKAHVIAMGNILHDWGETEKRRLIAKAFAAIEDGGAFIAIENVIDDARRENALGMLMSLNMLIETAGGFDYTAAQFDGWCREAGFTRTEIRPLAASSAAIAYK